MRFFLPLDDMTGTGVQSKEVGDQVARCANNWIHLVDPLMSLPCSSLLECVSIAILLKY